MTFYIFRCSKDRSLYGATDEPSGVKLPKDACSGDWELQRKVQESRIGFSATKAEQDIQKQGYYLFRAGVKAEVGVIAKPPAARKK
jgi:hypothetical protein